MLAFCSREHFIQRFSKPDRLDHLPDFKTLNKLPLHRHGAVSFFNVEGGERGIDIQYACSLKTPYRIQDVCFISAKTLAVGFEDRLEVWSLGNGIPRDGRIHRGGWSVTATIRHKHLAGLRTVHAIDPQNLVVASSGADGFFRIDLQAREEIDFKQMPTDLYGMGYQLHQRHDLHEHYVGNNYQRTHLNGAWPYEDGKKVVVSGLIQGAIGVFDLDSGAYRELVRGFEGCHGARVDDRGRIYFSDSCDGAIVFLDEAGKETFRYQHQSKWLHDACQIQGDLFALALADVNQLVFLNIVTGETYFKKPFLRCPFLPLQPLYARLPWWLGNSVQFLSYASE